MHTPLSVARRFVHARVNRRNVLSTILLGVALSFAVGLPSVASANAPAAAEASALPAGKAEVDIDAFWSAQFKDAGIAYHAPSLIGFDEPITTGGCGDASPQEYTTFYCELDDTVYYSISGVAAESERFGDAGWVNMMAHEWGHHVQLMLGVIGPGTVSDGVTVELQATCLAGLYVENAVDRHIVTKKAIAVMEDMFAGDADHGSQDELRDAFDIGFHGDLYSCGLTL